jgi:hypothetical protein
MRIDENMEVLLQSVANLFGDLKLNVLKGKLEDVIALQDTKSIADFTEECVKWSEKEYTKKQRMFVFSDGKLALTRIFIVSVEMDYTDEGVPEIIINRMLDDVTLKDNPYKNIHVRYENEENCSRDFDRLKLVLN